MAVNLGVQAHRLATGELSADQETTMQELRGALEAAFRDAGGTDLAAAFYGAALACVTAEGLLPGQRAVLVTPLLTRFQAILTPESLDLAQTLAGVRDGR
jgi:hypothetical protein